MCECYQIGGSFIAEDPDCAVHGSASHGRLDRIEAIIELVVAGEIAAIEAAERIEEEWY